MRNRQSFLATAVLAAIGCSSGGWPDVDGGQLDSGPVVVTPQAPGPAGEADAGFEMTDPGDASADAARSIPKLPPNFVLDCSAGAEPAGAEGDVVSSWQAERAAHGALGHAASIALHGPAYRVVGSAATGVLSAPLALQVKGPTNGLIGFSDAHVEGVAERGRVELYAGGYATDDLGRAPASAGTIDGLVLEEISVADGALEGTLALTHERVGNTNRYHAQATASDLAVENARLLYLYPDASSPDDQRVEWMPSGSVVFRTATSLTFYDEEGVSLHKDLAEPIELDYGAFSLAGDFAAGTVDADGLEVQGTPVAVFGRDLKAKAAADSFQSQGTFRLTQAVNEAGLVIPADVEAVPSVREVWVRPSETQVVQVHYRERSYAGDAVLAEIRAGGAAGDLLELQTGFMPTLTAQLIEAVIDTGWAAPLAAIVSLPTLSIVFVIDIFDCIFGGCASQPAPLDPFPQWMPAGEVGTMEVRVKGDLAPGTYDTSLTFVGRNYCPVTVELRVHIGEPPPDDDAGS